MPSGCSTESDTDSCVLQSRLPDSFAPQYLTHAHHSPICSSLPSELTQAPSQLWVRTEQTFKVLGYAENLVISAKNYVTLTVMLRAGEDWLRSHRHGL